MKNGFTLIELIAVILILAVISLFAFPSYLNNAKSDNQKIYDEMVETSCLAGKTYIYSNIENYSDYNIGDTYTIPLSLLISYGNVNGNIKNVITNASIKYDTLSFTVLSDNSLECNYNNAKTMCEAVTSATKTTGNIPLGNYDVGDEYICKVNEDTSYHFFVVGKEDDIVNLIMDRNICKQGDASGTCLVTFNSEYIEKSGPTTAMNYLNEATSNWVNLSILTETYEDESKNFFDFSLDGYRARLPYLSEVLDSGCNMHESELDYGTCPLWMDNYLNSSSLVIGENIHNVNGVNGYWTFSSQEGDETMAYYIYYDGDISSTDMDSTLGIRPVISIPKVLIK